MKKRRECRQKELDAHYTSALYYLCYSTCSLDFSSPHQSHLSRSLLLLKDSDGEGDSCGFSKASQQLQAPHGTASVQLSRPLSLLKQVTIHNAVLAGLTLLTSEQMEIIW